MKLEDQVCSLELAKRLKELGVKQESHFYWNELMPTTIDITPKNSPTMVHRTNFEKKIFNKILTIKTESGYSAFTVAELGEMLPSNFLYKGAMYFFTERYYKHRNGDDSFGWCVFYENGGGNLLDVMDQNEANARAKMLCHLIEKRIVKNDLRSL